MNAHAHISAAEPYSGFDRTSPTVSVSRVGNAAYALEKASMALSNAITPNSKRIAQQAYDDACADMLVLLQKRAQTKES